MKKILLIFIINFLFINSVSASNIENQLSDLQNNIKILKEEVNDLKSSNLDKMYPIGSIYTTTTYSNATEVNNALGGTWERYANGRSLVGVDENDTDFSRAGINDRGNKTTTLSISNLPSHNHSVPELSGVAKQGSTAATGGNHTHSIPALSGTTSEAGSHTHGLTYADDSGTINHWGIVWKVSTTSKAGNTYGVSTAGAHKHTFTTTTSTTGSGGAHTHAVTTNANTTGSVGSGSAFTNLSPYITVYMYKRIA